MFRREQESAREDLTQRQQLKLKCRHDTETATAAPERPEQIGFVFGIDSKLFAAGSNYFDGDDSVAGKAVFASVEANAAAKAIAGDANVWGGTMECGKALFRRLRDKIAPECSGTDPGCAGFSIDLDAAEACGTQQHSIRERAKRRRIMSCSLRGNPLSVGGGGADNIAHLIGTAGHRNGRRLLVDQDVEGSALKVPVGVLGGQECRGLPVPFTSGG